MDKDTNEHPKTAEPTNLQGEGPVYISKDEFTNKLQIIRSIGRGRTEADEQAKIRRADAEHKRHERNRQALEKVAEELISNPEIKNKWQDRIRRAIKYFEGKKTGAFPVDYFRQEGDALRNIDVIYLTLAMAHDGFFQMNLIITDELKEMNSELFCGLNYSFCCGETRLPLFWEHIKRDLNTGIDLASTKPSETKLNTLLAKNEEQEGMIVPKPPEFLQTLLWLWRHGKKHWKLILLAAIIMLLGFILQLVL